MRGWRTFYRQLSRSIEKDIRIDTCTVMLQSLQYSSDNTTKLNFMPSPPAMDIAYTKHRNDLFGFTPLYKMRARSATLCNCVDYPSSSAVQAKTVIAVESQ